MRSHVKAKLKKYMPDACKKIIRSCLRLVERAISPIIAYPFYLLMPSKVACNLKYFHLWEKKGFHITPATFSWPIPDSRTLHRGIWEKRSDLVGVNMHEEKQLKLLSTFREKFGREYGNFRTTPDRGKPWLYYLRENAGQGSVDAEIIHCMIRHFKPKRIFEIGAGDSTKISANACCMNMNLCGHDTELIAFEPYPSEFLLERFPGFTRLEKMGVQGLNPDLFLRLGENDILFIDSSHVLKIRSDVQYLFLEIIPRLKKGVLVHVHDIFFPNEYPEKWIKEWHACPNEQYLLQAFMSFNSAFETLWSGSYMHCMHPDELSKAFKSYDPIKTRPGAFWMQKTA